MTVKKILIVAMLAVTVSAFALKLLPFQGWSSLVEKSSSIVVVRCLAGDRPPSNIDGLCEADAEVVSVLKGITNLGPVRLRTTTLLHQGEHYLVFARSTEGTYDAFENYRSVFDDDSRIWTAR
jgi:hypothetical protein